MIDVVTAVRARVLAQSAVVALVVGRAFGTILPQGVTLPALRIQRVGEVQAMHLRGSVGNRRARVQVDSVGVSRASVVALDEAVYGDGVSTGLCAFRGTVGGMQITGVFPEDVREGYDAEELKQYKVMRDYMIHWKQ